MADEVCGSQAAFAGQGMIGRREQGPRALAQRLGEDEEMFTFVGTAYATRGVAEDGLILDRNDLAV